MKLKIISISGTAKGEKEMPKQFSEDIRPDLIKRAFLALVSAKKQPYGAYHRAGKRASAFVRKRRNVYRATYGIGQSRTPRKTMSRRGERFMWVGAFAPQTVGGRRAHPPKAEAGIIKKINKREDAKAIRSALSATIDKETVEQAYKVPDNYPFLIDSKIEDIKKTKELKQALEKIGIKDKALVVVSKKCSLSSIKNLPGVNIEEVKNLDIVLLAPGAEPGRLTLFTDSAIDTISKENLFIK